MGKDMEWKRIFDHKLVITFTDNGGVYCEAGCAKLCFTDTDEFIHNLSEALHDQERFERSYFRFLKDSEKRLENMANCRMENADPTLGCR